MCVCGGGGKEERDRKEKRQGRERKKGRGEREEVDEKVIQRTLLQDVGRITELAEFFKKIQSLTPLNV